MKLYPSRNKVSNSLTISGALDHDGSTIGFYGETPTAQTTGIAQLTDNTGGTANNILEAMADVGIDLSLPAGSGDVNNRLASIRNNFADLANKLNTIMTALKDCGLISE